MPECVCGDVYPDMDRFVDHLVDDHDAVGHAIGQFLEGER